MPRGKKKVVEETTAPDQEASLVPPVACPTNCCPESSVEKVVIEPVGTKEEKRGRKKKYGTLEEVWNGAYEQTNKGLKKSDLVKTKKNKVMSKKRYEALKKAGERLQQNRPINL